MFDNLYDFYRKKCEQYSDRIMFKDNMTYAEGYAIAEQRAAFIQSQGFKKGDVIALLAVSNPEWVLTYMAIGMMGGIVLPLDVNLPASQYPVMLKKMKAKAVFVSDEYKDRPGKIKTYSVALNKSNGDPKIVTLSHRNIFHTGVSTAKRAYMSPKDVMLCLLPLYHVYALDACFIGPFVSGSSFVWQTSLKGPDIMKSLAENPITI